MVDNIAINFIKGDTYSRDLVISNYKGKIKEVLFTVKNNESDKYSIMQKKINDGIMLADGDEIIGERTYNILINANETDDMKTNYDYYFAIKIFVPTSLDDIELTLIKGTLTLETRGD